MQRLHLWVNWKTRITHLSRDCHQIVRVPDDTPWLEPQEGEVKEMIDVGRRYCSWCVGRYLSAGCRAGVVPDADLHPVAERADYVNQKVTPRQ
jgi:hypothetical protein